MSIPPIISNLPIFKALKSGGADRAQSADASSAASATDSVELSTAIKSRIGDVKTLSPEQAAQMAAETSFMLEDGDLSLGLDPNFDR